MSVTERVHTFGERGNLVGIVTLPPGDDGSAAAGSASRPFVVILNAGLVHRVGSFRMSVELARRLAARGLRVLRYDQSGIGDSPSRGGAVTVEQQAVADCQEAMSFLAERYGARTFTVGGLCTGAMNAHRIGLADERVEALWLLDGYAYRTVHSVARHAVATLRRPKAWPGLGRRLVVAGTGQVVSTVVGWLTPAGADLEGQESEKSRTALFYQSWPPIPTTRADLERMLRRGVRFLFVYTGGWSSFNHVDQFDEVFPDLPGREGITVEFHPDADHTFLALEDREAMFRSVEKFVAGSNMP